MDVAKRSKGLVTYAPAIADPPRFMPTGNLFVSVPDISLDDGSIGSIGVLVERALGLVEARGDQGPLLEPVLLVDGQPVEISDLTWEREGDWLPHFSCQLAQGLLQGWYCTPVDERGAAVRLTFTPEAEGSVTLGWSGQWQATEVTHLRTKPVDVTMRGQDDPWTKSRVVWASAGLPLLALACQGGHGTTVESLGEVPQWKVTTTSLDPEDGSYVCDLFLGVSTEPDGAATTALHLRRRGFVALWNATIDWLDRHSLDTPEPTDALFERLNAHLFFNYFYAQGDCLDTGRPVVVTSRSRQYYVSAAFWSRDAYCWTFPALLLVDEARARRVLVASLEAGGERLAHHALYLNGTSLYPGFELDQAAAPTLAVWRYIQATGDWSILGEKPVSEALDALVDQIGPWRHPTWDLFATFLLPTDDPTNFAYVTTDNALLAAAFDALAAMAEGPTMASGPDLASGFRQQAHAIRVAIREHLVVDGPYGPMWAWACDAEGQTEQRDEPPLSLRTLPYFGLVEENDPVQQATLRWLTQDNPFHFEGAFAGSGSAHFPYPSGFDLANRMLDGDETDGTALQQFQLMPMDQGLGCESWDVATGEVRTGAAMASMSGLLAWTAWDRLCGQQRWDRPPGRQP